MSIQSTKILESMSNASMIEQTSFAVLSTHAMCTIWRTTLDLITDAQQLGYKERTRNAEQERKNNLDVALFLLSECKLIYVHVVVLDN